MIEMQIAKFKIVYSPSESSVFSLVDSDASIDVPQKFLRPADAGCMLNVELNVDRFSGRKVKNSESGKLATRARNSPRRARNSPRPRLGSLIVAALVHPPLIPSYLGLCLHPATH
jgi:hypothetical protein